MNQIAINYAIVLYDLGISKNSIEEAGETISSVPELRMILISPIIPLQNKFRIIEKIFPVELHSFLKVVCEHQNISKMEEIVLAYKEYRNEQLGILEARLIYATKPNQVQLDGVETFLKNKFNKNSIILELVEDSGLIGGFKIEAHSYESDWSIKGRLNRLQQKLVRR